MMNAQILRSIRHVQLIKILIVCRYLSEYSRHFQAEFDQASEPEKEHQPLENNTVKQKTASGLKIFLPPKAPEQEVFNSHTASGYNSDLAANSRLTYVYYYRARTYDPTLGRFLQPDPLGYHDSMNMYQGMFMNPQNYLDPFGQWSDLQNYLFRLKKKKGEKTAISWIENNITSGADKLALTMQMMYCTYDPDDPAASMGGVLYHWIAGMVDDVYDTFAKSWYGNFRKLALYNDADAGKRFIAENVFYAAFPYLLKGGAKLLARVS